MEAMNARQRASDNRAQENELEGRASNVMMGGQKFGWATHIAKSIGRRTQTVYSNGVKTERVWQDGELVSEETTPLI